MGCMQLSQMSLLFILLKVSGAFSVGVTRGGFSFTRHHRF